MDKLRKILVFDTETTGFEDDDQIIQIGSIMSSKGRTYTSEDFVFTRKEISIGSMTAHGIRRLPEGFHKSLKHTKTIKRINSLKKNDIVIGHNIDFDLRMARHAIHNNKFQIIDTLLIAEYFRKVGILKKEDKINLQYLRYLWISEKREKELITKHKPKGDAHSALFDSLITNEIAEIMINTLYEIGHEDPWEKALELYKNRFSPETVTISFGKHSGLTITEIHEINPMYLQWFYDNVDGREREKKAIINLSNQLKEIGK